jgi:hypothetical protein
MRQLSNEQLAQLCKAIFQEKLRRLRAFVQTAGPEFQRWVQDNALEAQDPWGGKHSL